MRNKDNRTFYLLLFSLFLTLIVLISLFFWAFGKQSRLGTSSYNLPGKVIEINGSQEDFHILKISHSYSVSHPQHIALSEKISFEIKKNMSHSIIPEIYPSGQLGSAQILLQAVKKGTLEMLLIPVDELWQTPEFSLFSIPYLFPGFDDLEQFMDHPEVRATIERYFRKDNVRYMGWGFNNPSHIFRLAGGREDNLVRLSAQNEYLMDFFKNAGFDTFKDDRIIPHSDLQNQPYEYAEISSENLYYHDKFQDLESFLYRNYLYIPCLYLINDSFWFELSPGARLLLQSSVEESIAFEKELVREREADYQKSLSLHFGLPEEYIPYNAELLKLWLDKNPGLYRESLK